MKYDEKTGDKKPESRSDEIKLSLEQLGNLQKQTNGLISNEFEQKIIQKDISISLGLIVDILGAMFNKMFGENETPKQ